MSTTVTSIVIAPQSGGAVFAKAGQRVRITDVAGKQVADTWAIDAADPTRWMSPGHTLSLLCRLFPQVGESFTDQHSEPIMRLHHDTSPGPHDMLYPPCDPALYVESGPDHPSCETNFEATAKSIGLDLGCVPSPVNLFQNSEPQPDRSIDVFESKSRPGDYVELVAERDVHVIVTACSVDNYATNGWNCTEIKLEVFDA